MDDDLLKSLLKESERRFESSKTRDRVFSLFIALILGFFLTLLFAEFSWTFFGFGMGVKYTEETILGYHGFLGYNFEEAIIPTFFFACLISYPIYKQIRRYSKKKSWFG